MWSMVRSSSWAGGKGEELVPLGELAQFVSTELLGLLSLGLWVVLPCSSSLNICRLM